MSAEMRYLTLYQNKRGLFLSVIILSIILLSSYAPAKSVLVSDNTPQFKGNVYRYDDGSYENAINWFNSKISKDWHGWGVRFILDGTDHIKITRIFIVLTKRDDFVPEEAGYDIAICSDLAGYPDTGADFENSNALWKESFIPPTNVPFWPFTVYVEHQVPNITVEPYFWVLLLPKWDKDIVPDPPYYLCLDTDTWLTGSYGNADNIDWYALPSIDPKYYGEFGFVVEGTRTPVSIQSSSLGYIKSLFE